MATDFFFLFLIVCGNKSDGKFRRKFSFSGFPERFSGENWLDFWFYFWGFPIFGLFSWPRPLCVPFRKLPGKSSTFFALTYFFQQSWKIHFAILLILKYSPIQQTLVRSNRIKIHFPVYHSGKLLFFIKTLCKFSTFYKTLELFFLFSLLRIFCNFHENFQSIFINNDSL